MQHQTRRRVSRTCADHVVRVGVAIGLTLACLLVAAPGAAGQDEKTAQKALKLATKDALKALKGSLSAAQTVAFAQIKLFDNDLKNDSYNSASLTQLGDALNDFQTEVVDEVSDARLAVAQVKRDELVALFAADGGLGPYPDGFSYGDGGTLDGFARQIDKLLAKSLVVLTKKLGKSRKLAAKAGIGFTFQLGTPTWTTWDSNTSTSGLVPGMTIDVALAASFLDSTNDATVVVSGTGGATLGAPEVSLVPAGGGVTLDDTPLLADARWISSFTSVEEKSYRVRMQQGGTGGHVAANIGVR